MGSSVAPSQYISQPDFVVPAAQLSLQSELGRQQLAQKDKLLQLSSRMPLESWTPDVWGESGLQNKASQIAAINAFKSKQLEEKFSPQMAALREQLPQAMLEDVQGNAWQKQMNDWARSVGLTRMLSSGLQDSTVGKSALFDEATLQGQAFKQAQLQRAANLLGANPAPQVGLDVGAILGAEQAAGVQNMQQRDAFRNMLLGEGKGAAQSTNDWINKMMGSVNSAAEAYRQDWKNYQQAMLDAAQKNADRQNALASAGIQAAGNVAGSAVGAGMFCWVAREVYGTENGLWLIVRDWVLHEAPRWLCRLYAQHGEWVAKFISNKPTVKWLLKKAMDRVIASKLAS